RHGPDRVGIGEMAADEMIEEVRKVHPMIRREIRKGVPDIRERILYVHAASVRFVVKKIPKKGVNCCLAHIAWLIIGWLTVLDVEMINAGAVWSLRIAKDRIVAHGRRKEVRP